MSRKYQILVLKLSRINSNCYFLYFQVKIIKDFSHNQNLLKKGKKAKFSFFQLFDMKKVMVLPNGLKSRMFLVRNDRGNEPYGLANTAS